MTNELLTIFTDLIEFLDSGMTSFHTKEPFFTSKLTIFPFGALSVV